MNPRFNRALFIVGGLLALAAGALLALGGRESPAVVSNATVYQSPRPLPALGLTDDTGSTFDATGLDGGWAWVFFGFTNCPDVCPMTMQTLATAWDLIEDDALRPRVVLVTVDPERDDVAELGRYARHFNPEFRGVSGSRQAIEALAQALYVSVLRIPLDDGGYTIDHSAAVFIVDPSGSVVAVSTPPHAARTIASAVDSASSAKRSKASIPTRGSTAPVATVRTPR